MNFNDCFINNSKCQLVSVSYKSIPVLNESIAFDVSIADELDVSLVEDQGVHIFLTRKMMFEPAGIFELSVTFETSFEFNKSAYKDIDWNGIDIKTEFINHSQHFLLETICRISSLISQITAASGDSPVILPPILMLKSNDK